MNRLKVHLGQAIKALAERDWSRRRVASELGLDRGTVRRHWPKSESNAAISTSGTEESNAAISTPGSPSGAQAGRPSLCQAFAEQIGQWLEAGLSAQRIYQDLVLQHQFKGSYQSVKRFVRRLESARPLPFRRMECAPGEEAQVDFGQGAWVADAQGKKRRPHLFRLVLSHSRKGYSEVVWRQDSESFLRALENAFRHVGGVPKTLVVDNLRAAVSRADWFDPEINPKLASFCAHYGCVVLPTKPAMPRHKGKIEAGIKYVQENALKKRLFASLGEQNLYLSNWEASVADKRLHGTTRQQVEQIFQQRELPALQPLPSSLFPVFQEARRKVHRDGYIEVAKAYYSVPPEYVSRDVWARWDSRLVRVYNHRMEQIALHTRVEPGRFQTDSQHVPAQKRCVIERGVAWLLERTWLIGRHARTWAEEMIRQRGATGLRVLQGLLSLAEEHHASELDAACRQAIEQGTWRLHSIKELLLHGQAIQQTTFLDTHPLIRELSDYEALLPNCFEHEPKPTPYPSETPSLIRPEPHLAPAPAGSPSFAPEPWRVPGDHPAG